MELRIVPENLIHRMESSLLLDLRLLVLVHIELGMVLREINLGVVLELLPDCSMLQASSAVVTAFSPLRALDV